MDLDRQNRVLWTLLIRGTQSILVQIPHGPPLHHSGMKESLWKVLLTPHEMSLLEDDLLQKGLTVTKIRQAGPPSEGALPEVSLNDLDSSQMVYHTEQCPRCFYFAPQYETQCGVNHWPTESLTVAKRMPRAVEDFENCPLRSTKERGKG